jgi:hypothetical protein
MPVFPAAITPRPLTWVTPPPSPSPDPERFDLLLHCHRLQQRRRREPCLRSALRPGQLNTHPSCTKRKAPERSPTRASGVVLSLGWRRTPPIGPYSRSEVIHRAGDESLFPAFERERPRIVNNFAASAPSGYEFSSISEKMNSTRLSNLPVVLGSGNEYSDEDELSLETITSGYKEFASDSGRANDRYPPSPRI